MKVCDELAALKSDGRHFARSAAQGASARMLSGRRYRSKQWVARWRIITHRNEKSKLNSCGCARYRPAGVLGPRIAAQSPRTFAPDAIEGFGGKRKGRTFWELCGLVCGAGAGIEKWPASRMDIGFYFFYLEMYRQKYRHFQKCPACGGIQTV